MATTPELKVNGIEIPKDDEKALFDAYRQDIETMSDLELLASELSLTINVYKPSFLPARLKGSLEPGQKVTLEPDERFQLEKPQQSVGNGGKNVDLFYNEHTHRYEVLKIENGRFVRVGNAGDDKDSFYHCMVNIEDSSVTGGKLTSRIAFYKGHLLNMKKPSDANVRQNLRHGVIPGNNTEDQLQRISRQPGVMRKRLLKLVRHLREELDTVEPPQRDRSKYQGTFQVTRHLVETLEYDYERRMKDFKFDHLVEDYRRIQQHRVIVLSQGYKRPLDWEKRDVYQKKLIKGSEDFKAAALVALLDDPELDVNEKFRLASNLVTSINPEKLKTAYMRIRGSKDVNRLEADLRTTFHVNGEPTSPLRRLGGITKYFKVGEGHKLQFPFLKSILETGELSPSALMAIKLGLMYRGAQIRNLTLDEKDDIVKLVEENPGELASLAHVGDDGKMLDTSNEFLHACYSQLETGHSAVLRDIQTRLQRSVSTRPVTGISLDSIAALKIEDGAARSLIRVMHDSDKNQLRKVGSSWTDTAPLKKKILKWITERTQEELNEFIKAGEREKASKPSTAYELVWRLIDGQLSTGLESGNWKKYFLRMAKARVDMGKEESEEVRPFYEVEAFLKYQKSRNRLLSYNEKKVTVAKVLNMLSASDDWDPMFKLKTFITTHPDPKIIEKYKEDPVLWLEELLEGGGVDAEGREQVHTLLYAGATFYGDAATDSGRNIDNYLSLKRKAHRRFANASFYGLKPQNILTIIGKVKPGSLEHWMMRKDKQLLTRIREELRDEYTQLRDEYTQLVNGQPVVDPVSRKAMNLVWSGICQTLDLNSKWLNLGNVSPELGDLMMPEPPSKDDLKAFKSKYKDEETKKKIRAGKYSLAYSLGKEQSYFNISDRQELLKHVYAAQLDGYQGEELIKMLDDIDPKIRESLERIPPEEWRNHEKVAHSLLQNFLIKNQKIDFKDFLNVAKGLFSNDYNVIEFAVEDIPPEQAATLWCAKSYDQLKTLCEDRLKKAMELHALNSTSTPETSEVKRLQAEMAVLDQNIKKHEFNIDDDLKSQLEGLTGEQKGVQFGRKVKQKIGEAMLNEPEKFEDVHIPPFALSLKGVRLLGEADIEYQHYLRSGVGYHRFSVSGLESYAQGSIFMRKLWKTAGAQPSGTGEEREKEEQKLLKEFNESHKDLFGSLDKWKGKQDEYTKRIVNVVNQTLGTVLTVAFAAAGVPAVAVIALGPLTGALNTVVKLGVERWLSREGDLPTQEIVKQVMVSAVAAVPTVLASVDYGATPGLKAIINNTIGSTLVKGQISSFSKAIVGGIGNIIAASGSGNFEMSSKAFKENIMKTLQNYNLTQPQIYKTVMGALSAEFNSIVKTSIETRVTRMDKDALDELEEDEKEQMLDKAKPYTTLYKNVYNKTMATIGQDLLAEGASKFASLPFADVVKVDKNKLEKDKDSLAIANTLVEMLAEKGLRVDANFDYSDMEKLIMQIAEKMPGVQVTREEKRSIGKELEDDEKFREKQTTLTTDEKKLTLKDQKEVLVGKATEKLLTERMGPWTEKLNRMRSHLEKECNAIKEKAEKQAAEDSKELDASVKAAKDSDEFKKGLSPKGEQTVGIKTNVVKTDDDIDIVAHSLATRLLYGKKKKQQEAAKKKVREHWRRHRAKKAAKA